MNTASYYSFHSIVSFCEAFIKTGSDLVVRKGGPGPGPGNGSEQQHALSYELWIAMEYCG